MEISFARWLSVGLPLTAVFLPAVWLLLTRLLLPVGKIRIEGGTDYVRSRLAALGRTGRAERIVLSVFLLTAATWILRPLIQGLELFDSSQTFSHYMERLVSSYALSSLSERGDSEELTGLDAEKFMDSVKNAKADSFVALGKGNDLRLSGQAVSGGALMAEERIVHLAVFATQSARERKRYLSRRFLDRTTE